ncbi:hypothetical protein [Ottowia sp.]|uniref:hypothetical protein n=1 Tax=Ottowia sp. TaxID=1898956 RepID=UPI0039E3F07B
MHHGLKTVPAPARQAQAAIYLIAIGILAGCAATFDAPRLAYQCPRQLGFEARLYQDMALLEGLRGHARLERVAVPEDKTALVYADSNVRASFGLGVDRRLVRLDYTGIPEPVYCERAPATDGATPAPVQPTERPGPRPPQPFDPNAPVQTNIRIGDGQNGPG